MQTYENVLLARLQDYGLWEEEAKSILEEFYKTKAVDFDWVTKDHNRVKDNMADYGPHFHLLLKIMWISLRSVAYEWIKNNHTSHFALAMFSDEDPEKVIEQQAKELEKKLESEEADIDPVSWGNTEIRRRSLLKLDTRRFPNLQQIPRKKE